MNEQQSSELNFRKNQGKLLKKARKSTSFKYSQEEVGKLVGLSQDTISKLEKGEQAISAYRLLEFAKIYNKPISFFYMVNTSDIKNSK